MPWYVAHAVMIIKFKDGHQDCIPIWENMILIEANDDADANEKAIIRAKEDEGDSDGTLQWYDRPAMWVLGGIKKINTVAHRGGRSELRHGDELTFSEYLVKDQIGLDRLLSGERVTIEYSE